MAFIRSGVDGRQYTLDRDFANARLLILVQPL
jgi:hypothetical protein